MKNKVILAGLDRYDTTSRHDTDGLGECDEPQTGSSKSRSSRGAGRGCAGVVVNGTATGMTRKIELGAARFYPFPVTQLNLLRVLDLTL